MLADADHMTQVAANFLVNSQHALAAQQGERRIKVRTFRTENGDSRLLGRGQRPRHSAEHPRTASSNPISPPSRSASAPASACRSRSRSSSATRARSGSRRSPPERRALRRRTAGLRRRRDSARDRAARSSADLRHALIIDDEPDVAGSLADILELMGVKSRDRHRLDDRPAEILQDDRARHRFQRSAHARARAASPSIANCSPSARSWRGASCWSPAT